MFRQYQDPWMLQDRLAKAQADLAAAIEAGESDETIFYLHEDVEELREKVNFAWQDEEASENGWDY